MKKLANLGLKLIFPVVFNIVFFMVKGFDNSASVWLSFAVINLAYLLILFVPYVVTGGREAAAFGPVIASMTTIHFGVQFVVGLVMIFIDFGSIKVPFIVHMLVAAVYAVLLFTNISANESTAAAVAKQEEDLQYIRKSSVKIKDLMADSKDPELKKKLEHLYDIVSSSPSKSSLDAREFEIAVNECIRGIESNLMSGDVKLAMENTDKAIRAAEMRNRRV